MGVITIAGMKIEVLPQRQTLLEAIIRNNGRRIIPNPFWNRILLEKNGPDNLKQFPNEILKVRPIYTGTAAVIGEKGRRLGNYVAVQDVFDKTTKTVIYKPTDEQKAFDSDTLLLCDGGFALFDEKNQPITPESIVETTELFAKFNGVLYTQRITNRLHGEFERVGGKWNRNHISNAATLGLLARLDLWDGHYGLDVSLSVWPSVRLGVAVEVPE